MKLRAVIIAVALIAPVVPTAVYGQPADAITQGYMRLYEGEPEQAQEHFDRMRSTHPDALAPWFASLFVTMARLDYDDDLAPAFERELDALIARATTRQGQSAHDVEALFFLAQAHLLRGTYRMTFEKGMWGAARDAARSKGFAEDYIRRHPEHGDAYLALGLYNYYVDIAPSLLKVLRILLFLPAGNRAEGLKQLERAAATGQVFAPFAHTALADIYGSFEGRLDEALPRAQRLVKQFPGNAEMRLELASLYLHPTVEDFTSAEQHYRAVHGNATSSRPRHISQRHSAILGLANVRRNQWRIEEAIALLTPAIDARPSKPAWVMPNLLLRRANYKMLLNDPSADDDARRVLTDASAKTWHEAAERQVAAIESRRRGKEGPLYAALIRGNRLVAEDRFDEAAAVYDVVGRQHPGDWQVRYRQAYLEFARGRYDAAQAGMQAIVDARAAMPHWLKAAALLNLAWNHDIQGRRADALKLYKRIVDDYDEEAPAGAARLGLIAPYRGPLVVTR